MYHSYKDQWDYQFVKTWQRMILYCQNVTEWSCIVKTWQRMILYCQKFELTWVLNFPFPLQTSNCKIIKRDYWCTGNSLNLKIILRFSLKKYCYVRLSICQNVTENDPVLSKRDREWSCIVKTWQNDPVLSKRDREWSWSLKRGWQFTIVVFYYLCASR
jgi:hypothetical protein